MILYSSIAEDVAHLHQPYHVLLAALGDEGEEVGGLGAGGEVEGVAAVALGL